MPAEGSINDEIDGAQWTKYRGSRYLNLMISAGLDAAFNNAGVQTPALDIAEVNNVEFERVIRSIFAASGTA